MSLKKIIRDGCACISFMQSKSSKNVKKKVKNEIMCSEDASQIEDYVQNFASFVGLIINDD